MRCTNCIQRLPAVISTATYFSYMDSSRARRQTIYSQYCREFSHAGDQPDIYRKSEPDHLRKVQTSPNVQQTHVACISSDAMTAKTKQIRSNKLEVTAPVYSLKAKYLQALFRVHLCQKRCKCGKSRHSLCKRTKKSNTDYDGKRRTRGFMRKRVIL